MDAREFKRMAAQLGKAATSGYEALKAKMRKLTNLTDEEIDSQLPFAHMIFKQAATVVDTIEGKAAHAELAKTVKARDLLKKKHADRPAKTVEGEADRAKLLGKLERRIAAQQVVLDLDVVLVKITVV